MNEHHSELAGELPLGTGRGRAGRGSNAPAYLPADGGPHGTGEVGGEAEQWLTGIAKAVADGEADAAGHPDAPRTDRTRLVPPPVLIGHAAVWSRQASRR